MEAAAVRALVEGQGFRAGEVSYMLDRATQTIAYEMIMWSRDAAAPARLEHALRANASVLGFRVRPGRD